MEEENLFNSEAKRASFAKIIVKLRTKRKLTQKQLADLIMVSDRTISKWENGLTVPDLINIRNICDALDISPNNLVVDKKSIKDYFHILMKYIKIVLDYILKNIFIITFIISFILLLLYFINNYNTINMYNIRIDDESNIRIKSGLLINSRNENVLVIHNISLKKYDYQIDKVHLELYTYVNGDKYVLYESANLNDVYINESNYTDLLKKDVMKEIKNNTHLLIEIKDKKGKSYEYETIVDFVNNFSNDKLIYSNAEYMKMNSPIHINNYNEPYELNYKYNDKVNVIESNNNVNIENKLKELGYVYDKEKDEYCNENKSILVKNDSKNKIIKIKKRNNNQSLIFIYDANNNVLWYKINDKNNKNIMRLKYNFINNEITCINGQCEKYSKELYEFLPKIYEITESL